MDKEFQESRPRCFSRSQSPKIRGPPRMKKHQTVLVVDFGGQYTQLIVRRVREMGVYSEMVPWPSAEAKIREMKPDAVILSGGPKSVLEECAPTIDFEVLKGIPTLGICYGH